MYVPVNDRTVAVYLQRGPKCKALIDDERQSRSGVLWAHILDMANRGLVIIEIDNETARLA